MIVWLNGTRGVGKTTTSGPAVAPGLPDVRCREGRRDPHPGDADDRPGRAVLARDQRGPGPAWRPGPPLRPARRPRHPSRAHSGGRALRLPGFRPGYLGSYAEAARGWLHEEAEVIDTTHLLPAQVARQIADAVNLGAPVTAPGS